MDTQQKSEELKFVISRFDHYYDSVNNKGNLYLVINTFILGGVITGFATLNEKCHFECGQIVLFVLTLIANQLSFLLTLIAIKPYANWKKGNSNGSILYFGDVADYHSNQYSKRWKSITHQDWLKDLEKQSQLLAQGLKIKFKLLSQATWLIVAQALLVATFCIYLLNN